MNDPEILKIGCIAKCQRNKNAIITEKIFPISPYKKDAILYKGIGFDGKPWQSRPNIFSTKPKYISC